MRAFQPGVVRTFVLQTRDAKPFLFIMPVVFNGGTSQLCLFAVGRIGKGLRTWRPCPTFRRCSRSGAISSGDQTSGLFTTANRQRRHSVAPALIFPLQIIPLSWPQRQREIPSLTKLSLTTTPLLLLPQSQSTIHTTNQCQSTTQETITQTSQRRSATQ